MPLHPTPTEAEMREVVLAVRDAWNTHDVDRILDHVTEDVVLTQPAQRAAQGKDRVASALADMFTGLPDLHFPREDFHVLTSADPLMAVSVWTMTATMTGPLAGLPATGRPVRLSGTALYRFRGLLVSEKRIVFDGLDFLQQLGLLPREDSIGLKAGVLVGLASSRARHLLHR